MVRFINKPNNNSCDSEFRRPDDDDFVVGEDTEDTEDTEVISEVLSSDEGEWDEEYTSDEDEDDEEHDWD